MKKEPFYFNSTQKDKRLKQIERIMYKLGRLWVQKPNMRFGQLVHNYIFEARPIGFKEQDIFNFEDGDTEKFLNWSLKQLKKRSKNA